MSDFELLTGRDALTSYRFGTGAAEHLFCRHCGVKSFYQPRSHPGCVERERQLPRRAGRARDRAVRRRELGAGQGESRRAGLARLRRRCMHRPLRLTVDRSAIQANWRWLQDRAGVPAGAAVKADGYGLGARETTEALHRGRLPRFLRLDLGRGRGARRPARRAPAWSCFTASGRTTSRRRWRLPRGRCLNTPSRSRGGRRSRRAARAT